MKQTISAPSTVPTANIAVNKSRLKVYNNVGSMPTYYLQKGQEFMIELSNPTTDVVMAKVILNGKPISQGGLVLNPGQRVFLERYLDVAKKFLFDTYEVSNSDEMQAAIANNGDIKVEFYKECKPYFNPYITTGFYPNGVIGSYNTQNINYLNNNLTPSRGITDNPSVNYSNTLSDNIQGTITTATANFNDYAGATLDMLDMEHIKKSSPEPTKKILRSRSMAKLSIETGRVEKGSDSDQTLKYINKTFEYTAFHTIEYKMLPVSQKVNTIEDINVKVYCVNCGAKLGKTDRFCGSCGCKK